MRISLPTTKEGPRQVTRTPPADLSRSTACLPPLPGRHRAESDSGLPGSASSAANTTCGQLTPRLGALSEGS